MMNINGDNWIEKELYSKIKEVMPVPCVDLVIVNDGRVLLMLRNNEPGKDLWFTPGGRVLRGEELDEAVKRILLKETGLTYKSLEQVGTMCHHWPDLETITTYYLVEVDSDEVRMNQEHRDYIWVRRQQDDLHPYVLEMIREARGSVDE
jgi:colanic acid biosynthesis protein WcaH